MNNLNIIDQFMQTFSTYIDSGFGLLNGNVVSLSSILIGIDMTLAGLFWSLDHEADVLARLIKKVLYIGTFAYIIDNFQNLATIVFNSFTTLGLNATATGLTAADLQKPGMLAGTGFQAAWPLLQQAGSLIGFTSVFTHLVIIIVLVIAWFIVIISFFLLAVQLFITILEFKLTTLAGFTLIPFALWNKTSFLAERVLGNVVSSGIKVMVLSVIIGIGDTLFSTFTSTPAGQSPTIAGAMSLVLAAITLLGLGIFGPAIATGLVSGAPQLGAGAAIGTAGALAGTAILAGGAAIGGARLLGAAGSGGLAAIRAGTPMGSAAATAYGMGQAASGATGMGGVAAGFGGMARAGGGAVMQAARSTAHRAGNAFTGSGSAPSTDAAGSSGGPTGGNASMPPAWAQRLQADQRARHHRQVTGQAIREGDRPGAPANPDLDQEE
jgi:type IV secretion system protein TrbL